MECCGKTQLWLEERTVRSAGHGLPFTPIRSRQGDADFTPSQSDVMPSHSRMTRFGRSLQDRGSQRYKAARLRATSGESGSDAPFNQCTPAARKRFRNAGETA